MPDISWVRGMNIKIILRFILKFQNHHQARIMNIQPLKHSCSTSIQTSIIMM